MLETLLSGICQGFIWAILALGVYVSFRLLDFADLTCEGSITLGASVAAMLIWKGCNPFLAALLSFIAGLLAGAITGVLHTKLKIPPILAGILTMISLYSINIHIMSLATGVGGTANLSLLNFKSKTIFAQINKLLGIGKTNTATSISTTKPTTTSRASARITAIRRGKRQRANPPSRLRRGKAKYCATISTAQPTRR